ncbi:hypothetical protein [Geobacter sp. DSM 9736]|uniref:hypothetical protein n=1 Tax=Geobacter sp. DSM 9736 TaxID=1277350 RepID=UPI000B513F27|nr:hypothetical protein [Geobacter sp. DSM 9736]SNB46228.1 hypothetical protein SAMN06269301_1672 [Geobacter sp. DSM 9736]
MKVTIHKFIQGERLPHLVPPAYREEVARRTRPNWIYSLLLFAHNRRDVVPSPPVRRGLRRLGEAAPDGIVLVGAVFTEEARHLVEGMKATIVTMHRTYWTDESARLRQH